MAFEAWAYKIQQNLTGATQNAPYQITVHAGAGTNDSSNLYLGSRGSRSDFQDVIFVESTLASIIPWRRVSVDYGTSAVFEINPPFSGAGFVYALCGNSAATSQDSWNGTAIYTDDGTADLFTKTGCSAADLSLIHI